MNTKANLLHHLESTHEEILNQYMANKTKPQTSQLVIGKESGTLQLGPFGKQDQITESIVQNLISEGGMSISSINSEWFAKFCNIAIPQYRIPSRNKIISVINEKYHCIYKNLINSLSNLKFTPSLTIDCWTGLNRKSYIASIVHFYSEYEFKLKSGLIFIKELPPSHTAKNIRNMFKDLCLEIKLKYFLIATITQAI